MYCSLSMTYKLYCDRNYYGPACSVNCTPQDSDAYGHYTCDPYTGDKLCRPGQPITSFHQRRMPIDNFCGATVFNRWLESNRHIAWTIGLPSNIRSHFIIIIIVVVRFTLLDLKQLTYRYKYIAKQRFKWFRTSIVCGRTTVNWPETLDRPIFLYALFLKGGIPSHSTSLYNSCTTEFTPYCSFLEIIEVFCLSHTLLPISCRHALTMMIGGREKVAMRALE